MSSGTGAPGLMFIPLIYLFLSVFLVLRRTLIVLIEQDLGGDGGNRTRNIAVYTWRLSPLSCDRHPRWATTVTQTELQPSPKLSYNRHPYNFTLPAIVELIILFLSTRLALCKVFDENSQSSLGSLSQSLNKKRKNWGDVGHLELAGLLHAYTFITLAGLLLYGILNHFWICGLGAGQCKELFTPFTWVWFSLNKLQKICIC